MIYVDSEGNKISEKDFRNQHPSITFSNPINAETLTEYGLSIYHPVIVAPEFRAITRLELRAALLKVGITSANVLAVIDAIPDDTTKETALMFWEDAQIYHREHELLAQIAAALGMSSDQVDEAWPE